MSWPCPPSLLPVDEEFHLAHTPKRGNEVPKLCAQALGPLLSPPPLDHTGEKRMCLFPGHEGFGFIGLTWEIQIRKKKYKLLLLFDIKSKHFCREHTFTQR